MTKVRPGRLLALGALSRRATRGWLTLGPQRWPCALGRSGQRAIKREGDGATPIGIWPLRSGFFRADRIGRPRTGLGLRAMRRNDGWCDAATDRNYNRPVRLPYPASAEEMWRGDGLYDLVLVIGTNDCPRRRGAGSAIFLHLAHDDLAPTAGCIALRRRDAMQLIARLRPGDRVRVGR